MGSTEDTIYLGISEAAFERHLALVPHFRGLEALCGRVLLSTTRVDARGAMSGATCDECRRIARASLANGDG